ncbi:MAG: MBL fold metallo-hydrolase [Bacillota bacterium]
MKILWLGHACFMIILSNGKAVITDPFDQKLGYPVPNLAADFVTVSHQHFDHNAVKSVPGKPVVVQEEGRHSFAGITFTGVSSFHDNAGGGQRGKNTIFVIEAEGLRVCHLGDLGHVPDAGQAAKIGAVDILMVPVGGFYTIGPDQAVEVVDQLSPRVVLPMHYKTRYIELPISTADEFLKNYPGHRVEQELQVAADSLPPGPQVVLLALKK